MLLTLLYRLDRKAHAAILAELRARRERRSGRSAEAETPVPAGGIVHA